MTIKQTLLVLTLAGTLVLPTAAQVQKIGTIDLRKVFDNYWKTKQADFNLKDEASGLDKERKTMVDQFTKEQEGYKKLLDSASDSAVSVEERDKRKKSAEDTLLKLREIENNIKQFDTQARSTLGEKQRRMRDNILEEIRNVIKAKAKAGSYNLVIDTAAESVNNTPIILHTTGENDITDDVLKDLNVNAPPPPKAAEPKPSPAPAEKNGKK